MIDKNIDDFLEIVLNLSSVNVHVSKEVHAHFQISTITWKYYSRMEEKLYPLRKSRGM